MGMDETIGPSLFKRAAQGGPKLIDPCTLRFFSSHCDRSYHTLSTDANVPVRMGTCKEYLQVQSCRQSPEVAPLGLNFIP